MPIRPHESEKSGARERGIRYPCGVTRDELVRKLRNLRLLERRVRGIDAGGRTELWDEYFSTHEGARVRFPFRMLLVFDRESRERAFQEFLLALWARESGSPTLASTRDRELLAMLGLEADASPEDVRSAFRSMARALHPDLGGDEVLVRELLEKYRGSSFGSRDSR